MEPSNNRNNQAPSQDRGKSALKVLFWPYVLMFRAWSKSEDGRGRKATAAQSRGKLLGRVYVAYVGGFDLDHKANTGVYSTPGWLNCYENEVYYKKRNNDITIPSDQIVSFEVSGETSRSRLSVTRMAALGVFSLAAPKRSKDASVIIGLRDGRQVLFHTKHYDTSRVHRTLADAISHYSRLQAGQAGQAGQQQTAVQSTASDPAKEIMKYATLRKRGVITEEEFQTKKRELLGL